MKRFLCSFLVTVFGACVSLGAQERPGADAVAPLVAAHLASLPFSRGFLYELSESETKALFESAARFKVNVFELLDCAYRYLEPLGFRAVLRGEHLRSAAAVYDFGGARVAALLPVAKTERIEIGTRNRAEDGAMDVYLTEDHSEYIEIGTAVMERRFGFRSIEPLSFLDAYGIAVKRFPISTELVRLDLYEPLKIAIFVKALVKPKRWRIDAVRAL